VMIGFLFYFHWIIGTVFFILLIIVFVYMRQQEKVIQDKQIEFFSKLSYQVKDAGEDIFLHLPIGIIIYNEDYKIKWANPYMLEQNDHEELFLQSLDIYGNDLINQIKEGH